MRHSVHKVIRHTRQFGFISTCKTIKDRLLHAPGTPQVVNTQGKRDYIKHYEQILGHAHGDAADLKTVKRGTVQWVIPNFGFGSGGHLNIFRFINMLSEHGYDQRLVILGPHDWINPQAAEKAIADWYFPLKAKVALDIEGFVPSAVTFATGWQTAYWVSKHRATRHKLYFVQDFEPNFHAMSSEYLLAENTYRLGLRGITAGSWLSEKLSREYGMECDAVSFGVEHDHYVQTDRRDKSNFNIFFYSRHVTQRRLFELGLIALKKVCEAEAGTAVIFAGGDVSGVEVPFHHLNAGELTLDELPDLYSQCDLALVLSGTNLSLLPLELAACGCPVVMNDSPSTRWLLPEDAAYYAAPTPDDIANVLLDAVRDKDTRLRKAKRAKELAAEASWLTQAEKLAKIVEQVQRMI